MIYTTTTIANSISKQKYIPDLRNDKDDHKLPSFFPRESKIKKNIYKGYTDIFILL